MQKVNSKSSAYGDGFSADEDEFYDAVELLEDDLDCSETSTSSCNDTRSSGVEGDGGVGTHHDILNNGVDEGGLDVDGETVAAAATSPTAPPVNLDSCGINSSVADSKNQVEYHHHASMNKNFEVESEHTVKESIETNDEGEKISAASTKPTLTKILTPINLHSSPCRGQNVYNIESPLEALYSIGSQGGKKLPPSFSPTRTSCVIESDDESLRVIRSLPITHIEHTANQDAGQLELNLPDNSDSDSDSDSDSVSVEKRYQIVNKDTGMVHDVRQVMKEIYVSGSSDILDTNYSLLPSRAKLEHQQSQRIRRSISKDSDDSGTHQSTRRIHWYNSKDSDDSGAQPSRRWIHFSNSKDSIDSETHAIPSAVDSGVSNEEKTSEPKKGGMKFPKMPKQSSKMAENVRKGMAELKKSRAQKSNRKRTSSADMVPSNAVYVRSSSRPAQTRSASSGAAGDSQDIQNESSFNPMLLIKTTPNAHKGPAWCASFSQNGRFLATGGGDGNVCIWAVSPKSKVIHPDGVQIHPDGADTDTLSEENSEKKECVTKDKEKNNASSPVPPLHFIGTGPALATNLEILSSEPIRRFKDHTAHVIDLSWSRSNFLLSASLDSSVRLYHYSKPQCLHCFNHAASVASVAFHPKDDRYFISGGVDKKLRLWDITDGRVKEWAQAPDAITATRFTPDGKYAVAGLFHGQVYFYDAVALKYYTQIACRNRSGKYSKGAKVTGISFVREERDDWPEVKQKYVPECAGSDENHASLTERLSDTGKDVARRILALRSSPSNAEALRYTESMLVSTNDSRVRLYGLNDFCLSRKYKGHINCSMQIRARLSESGSHLASGSESGHVFIWDTLDKKKPKKNTINMSVHLTHSKTKSSDNFEASRAHLPIVTDAVFFRSKSVNEALLSSDHVFPFALGMDRVGDDMSSAAILTLDYDGTMRVFLRKSCIDNILDAATPRGNTMT